MKKTIIKPYLISSYNRRVENFINKMEVQPVRINTEFSQYKNTDISQENLSKFKFRDQNDWNSILTILERVQKNKDAQKHRQCIKNIGIPFQLLNRSINSQENYEKSRRQFIFRDRQIQKQIHQSSNFRLKNYNTRKSVNNNKKSNDTIDFVKQQRFIPKLKNTDEKTIFKTCKRHDISMKKSSELLQTLKQKKKSHSLMKKSIKIDNKSLNRQMEKFETNTKSTNEGLNNSKFEHLKKRKLTDEWNKLQHSIKNKKEDKLYFKASIERIQQNIDPNRTQSILQICNIIKKRKKHNNLYTQHNQTFQ